MNKIIQKAMQSIKETARSNGLMYLTAIGGDFLKVLAEYKYDALAKTQYFQRIVGLDKKVKLLIVTVMFSINAFLKPNLTENTPWNLLIKEILTDAFPEIGKRIINGDNSPDPEEQEVIELIRKVDGNGNAHYAPKDLKKNPPGKGAFSRAKTDIEKGLNFFSEEIERRRIRRKGEKS